MMVVRIDRRADSSKNQLDPPHPQVWGVLRRSEYTDPVQNFQRNRLSVIPIATQCQHLNGRPGSTSWVGTKQELGRSGGFNDTAGNHWILSASR